MASEGFVQVTHRQPKMNRARGHSAGWTSPALIPMIFLLALLGFVVLGVFSEFKPVRVVSIVLLAAAVLFVFARISLARIRKGNEVEVTRRGKYLGRRGTVVKVLPGGNLFEVRLHEAGNEGATTPGETVKLYWSDLKKVFLHR